MSWTNELYNVYEQVAKEYGYKTREDTKELDFNSPNGMTMLKTVEVITTPYLEEIERLNKELETLKQPQVFIDTQDMEERYGEDLYKEYLEKENKRLNNIINELEKWLRSEIKRIEELQNPAKSKVKPYGEEYNNYTLIIGAYDNVLDKLQELKGSGSNE